MKACIPLVMVIAVGFATPFIQPASAQPTLNPANGGFTEDVIETDITYQTPGGTTLLTAQNLFVTRQLSDYMDGNFVNGILYTTPVLESLGVSPPFDFQVPFFNSPLKLTPYAAANLPLLGGATEFDFLNVDLSTPAASQLTGLLLNHTGTIQAGILVGNEFTAGPADLEGLLPGATLTSLSNVQVDQEAYFDIATNSANTEIIEPFITANFDQITIVETVGVPDNSNAAPLLGIALMGLLAFGFWKSRVWAC